MSLLSFSSLPALRMPYMPDPNYEKRDDLVEAYDTTLRDGTQGEGITSNAVSPALIDTEMVRANPRANPSLIPIGRFGTAEEVAAVVVMLAQNGYITGQTINANGGWYPS